MGTPFPVSVAPAALSRRRQKAGGQQQVPQIHFVKMSRQPLREPRKRARDGTGRKCANLMRPGKCRMKAESRFPRHFAVRHRMPCGRNPPPASAPQGNGLQKGQTRFARGRTPSRAGKALRSPVFLSFCTRRNCLAAKKFRLCGRRFVSLRKAILFLPRKKRPQGQRNAPYEQFLHPFFNSPAPICSRSSCH